MMNAPRLPDIARFDEAFRYRCDVADSPRRQDSGQSYDRMLSDLAQRLNLNVGTTGSTGSIADLYALENTMRLTSGYCYRSSLGLDEPGPLYVVPTPAVARVLEEMQKIVEDPQMYFEEMRGPCGTTRLYAKYNRIIGSKLLAMYHTPAEEWR